MVGAVEGPEDAAVLVVAVGVGEVLVQRPALRDVDQLHPAADPEERHVALQGPPGQRDLERVALGHRMDDLGMARRAVRGRVDVGAAREDQGVEEVEDLVGVVDEHVVHRQDQRHATGAVDGVDVGARQQERLLVPHAPLRLLEVGDDPDHRSPGHGLTLSIRQLELPTHQIAPCPAPV